MVIGCIKPTHCCESLTFTCHFVMQHEFDILEAFDKKSRSLIMLNSLCMFLSVSDLTTISMCRPMILDLLWYILRS